jgi:putative membrane protein
VKRKPLTFYCIGQLQTLLIVLGNLFYIQIQCPHPVLYWFACSVTSLVFTIFMYALTVAFGNIGEALAIIFMVVQVAGSGGTFPIDVLPKVYRMIYRYLPFPYAMDALRETIGGMYGNYYWECIGRLFIYIIIAILIGLVLRKPFEQLNHYMERSKENSGVML